MLSAWGTHRQVVVAVALPAEVAQAVSCAADEVASQVQPLPPVRAPPHLIISTLQTPATLVGPDKLDFEP